MAIAPSYIRIILGMYCVVIVALALWPFKLSIPSNPVSCNPCENGATWNTFESRVDFREPGLIRSLSAPTGLHNKLVSGRGLTVEAWLATASISQTGPARILSYSQNLYRRNFMLGQDRDSIVFRLRTTKTDLNGTSRQIKVPQVLLPGRRQHIVVTYDFSDYRLYVDGRLRMRSEGPGGTFSNWDHDYGLLIGNENTGNRPWIGSLEGFALYDWPLSMKEVAQTFQSGTLFADHSEAVAYFEFSDGDANVIYDESGVHPTLKLEIPDTFPYEREPAFLTRAPRGYTDYASNFVMYFVFGSLFTFGYLNLIGTISRMAGATLFTVALLAFVAESLQYFVPARTSSLYDFAACIIGGLIGCFVTIALKQYFRES